MRRCGWEGGGGEEGRRRDGVRRTCASIAGVKGSAPSGMRLSYSLPVLMRRSMSLLRVSILVSRKDWRLSSRQIILSSVTFDVSSVCVISPSVVSPKRVPFWLSRLSVSRLRLVLRAVEIMTAPSLLTLFASRLSDVSVLLVASAAASGSTMPSSRLQPVRLRSEHVELPLSASASCGASSAPFICMICGRRRRRRRR